MPALFSAILPWKPYSTIDATKKSIDALEVHPLVEKHTYYLALPYNYLFTLAPQLKSASLILGADGIASVVPGSFTAPVAVEMLKNAGAKFVLVGTADRRSLGIDDEKSIRNKIASLLEGGLSPFLCVGENQEAFESGHSAEVLKQQLLEGLEGLNSDQLAKVKIVYEAPWMNERIYRPDLKEVNDSYQQCCKVVKDLFGEDTKIEVFCGLPEEITDIKEVTANVSGPGVYFAHAALHLESLSDDWHPALPSTEQISKELEKRSDASADIEAAAAVVGNAVIEAAHEVEGVEKSEEDETLEEEEAEFEDLEIEGEEETEEDDESGVT